MDEWTHPDGLWNGMTELWVHWEETVEGTDETVPVLQENKIFLCLNRLQKGKTWWRLRKRWYIWFTDTWLILRKHPEQCGEAECQIADY